MKKRRKRPQMRQRRKRRRKKPKCGFNQLMNIFTELEMAATYEERKKVFENLKVLVKPEQEEVFRIIRKTKENYTENSNGIFFDLSLISDETFNQIKEYLDFCLKTRQDDAVRLKELETIRIQNENYVDEEQTS
jgi:hypothetical protein